MFDRFGEAPNTLKVNYSSGNPQGKYFGVDNFVLLKGVFRSYLEKETLVGPAYAELIPDRIIVFHKVAPNESLK